ncbi:MAG: DUF2807 domain-containing protein [Legionellaceae bacterium]|nr:DUF2807 domain-containing protein [Legionellaceae bacterium]
MQKKHSRITVQHTTSEFSKVNITGNIDVVLHSRSKNNKIIIKGDSLDIENTTRVVKDNELIVNVGKGYPKSGRMKIDVYASYYTSFTFHGAGSILAKGQNDRCLDLLIDNKLNALFNGRFNIRRAQFMSSGRTKIRGMRGCATQMLLKENASVKLVGYANIASLVMEDSSKLSLFWTKSKTLNVKLKDKAHAQMAGVTETLHLELWGSSRFNGRYLMTANSFVKTHGMSEADISVTRNQHVLAKDKSNVYYYYLPEAKTDFMAEEGSVLDMREWERPFLKSPTRYNR